MELLGTSLIGASRGQLTSETSRAVNPATGETLEPAFHSPTSQEAQSAVQLAAAAFPIFSATTGQKRGELLRQIAANIEAIGDALRLRACAESGLPEARIKMETGRTCGQLRMFASLAEEGSWVDARIDNADPGRTPVPKPDVRSLHVALGPVAVFCASNFPLAFSVAGGDTASALAAGCPVVVKAHSSHPGTAEMVAGAVRDAVAACGLPEGVFSLLFGSGREIGQLLVTHPDISAVGFTGSRSGGRTLMDLAAARPHPIPVYAEMSSINPVFLTSGALAGGGAQLAAALHGSVTMGVGQFCTNPGLVIVDAAAPLDAFRSELVRLFAATPPAVMLNAAICSSYRAGIENLKARPGVTTLAAAPAQGGVTGAAAVFETNAAAFLADPSLSTEVFGPSTLIVKAQGLEEMAAVAASLEGQLTATLHATPEELPGCAALLAILQRKAGRLLLNGFPTGVEVGHAMVHGGPYPAAADGRSTSVGTQAIYRFSRPVCYQNFPDSALPPALQEANPLKLFRMVDGVRRQG